LDETAGVVATAADADDEGTEPFFTVTVVPNNSKKRVHEWTDNVWKREMAMAIE